MAAEDGNKSRYGRGMRPVKDTVAVLAGLATFLAGTLTSISWFTSPSNGPVIDGAERAISALLSPIGSAATAVGLAVFKLTPAILNLFFAGTFIAFILFRRQEKKFERLVDRMAQLQRDIRTADRVKSLDARKEYKDLRRQMDEYLKTPFIWRLFGR
jgi:hypothetical protein